MKRTNHVTEAAAVVLEEIARQCDEEPRAGVSQQSIADEIGRAQQTVNAHIITLRKAGLLTMEPGRYRSVRLTASGRRFLNRREQEL